MTVIRVGVGDGRFILILMLHFFSPLTVLYSSLSHFHDDSYARRCIGVSMSFFLLLPHLLFSSPAPFYTLFFLHWLGELCPVLYFCVCVIIEGAEITLGSFSFISF